jgi:alpha-beta hydrolase superfamily lysophospholipase
MRRLRRLVWIGLLLVALLLGGVLGVRAWQGAGQRLALWHTEVPVELSAAALDRADWAGWLAAEERAFADLRRRVTEALPAEDRVPINRYFAASPLHPAGFARDWNRSFILEPEGAPRGAAVFLHGLTDAPYSLRHLAEAYRARGFISLGLRLPGHGTVPAGLTEASWEQWMAATRLAMREARRRVGEGVPIHLVGYSNGGALAVKHALDGIEDPRLPRAERLVLLSPMIGVTGFARFAGIAGWPALLPAFAGAAWLDILPEFNPFKYNSFPVNAARQSWQLSTAVQAQIRRLAEAGRLTALPPVLTFQSVADFTVSAPAVVSAFYALLPANGSELVLFDLNRNAKLGPLIQPAATALADQLLPPGPRNWRAGLVTNLDHETAEMVERRMDAGATEWRERPLGLAWPRGFYSLSHVALPFPPTDGLYGFDPDPAEGFGLSLGTLAPRGERGVLVMSLDALLRASSNPFFSYMLARIEEGLAPGR